MALVSSNVNRREIIIIIIIIIIVINIIRTSILLMKYTFKTIFASTCFQNIDYIQENKLMQNWKAMSWLGKGIKMFQ